MIPYVPAVKCSICGQLHEVASQTFVTFAGNVNVGLFGGVIGNNFANAFSEDSANTLTHLTIVCRTRQCVEKALAETGVWKDGAA